MTHIFTARGRRALIAIAIAATFCSTVRADDSSGDCPILNRSQVESIRKKPAALKSSVVPRGAKEAICRFVDGNTFVELRRRFFDSEPEALAEYRRVLSTLSSASTRSEPLHGVGLESRLLIKGAELSIVARFGTLLVVVSTNDERAVAVSATRAIGAAPRHP